MLGQHKAALVNIVGTEVAVGRGHTRRIASGGGEREAVRVVDITVCLCTPWRHRVCDRVDWVGGGPCGNHCAAVSPHHTYAL
jgi:hypothetical protein